MTNTRSLGLAIAGIGAVMTIVGLIGWVSSGGEPDDTAATTTAVTSAPATTATTAAAVTTATTTAAVTTTTAPPTTTLAEPTTTAPPPATTTSIGPADIAGFVEEFAAALEAGDEAFVSSRLHPEVVDGFGADLCAGWISTEIMTLSNYRLIDGPDGPIDQSFATPSGDRSVSDAWSGRVAFTFQGEDFEGDAGFAILDGTVYWLGQCR